MALGARRTRIILILAVVGIATLTVVGAALEGARGGPAYLRISVSEKRSVYLEFQGSEVRVAMTAEGLKTAVPVKRLRSLGNNVVQSPEITLPIPADQLPAGITAVKAGFGFYHVRFNSAGGAVPYVGGEMQICRADAQKAEWECVVRVWSQPGAAPDRAPAVQLPSLEKLTVSVVGKPMRRSLGVGVRLLAGTTELSALRKDGKPVEAKVTVTDSSGRQVASKAGRLADFGFS